MIETERLILRPITLNDAPAIFELSNDPDVMKYLGGVQFKSVDEAEEMIKKNVLADYEKYGFGRWAITMKPSDEYIGFTGLKYNEDFKEIDIGYRLMKKHWGKGIATEASIPMMEYGFNTLGLKRIVALADEENKASTNIMKKLGMSFEKYMKVDGEDCICYVLEK